MTKGGQVILLSTLSVRDSDNSDVCYSIFPVSLSVELDSFLLPLCTVVEGWGFLRLYASNSELKCNPPHLYTIALLTPLHPFDLSHTFFYRSNQSMTTFFFFSFSSQLLGLVLSCKYPTLSIAVISFCSHAAFLLASEHSLLDRIQLIVQCPPPPLFGLPNEQLRIDIFLSHVPIAHSFFFLWFLLAPIYPLLSFLFRFLARDAWSA